MQSSIPRTTGLIQVEGHQLWMDARPILSVVHSALGLQQLRGQTPTLNPQILSDPELTFSQDGPQLDTLLSVHLSPWLRDTPLLLPQAQQTLPLSRWNTRSHHVEKRLKLQEQTSDGYVRTPCRGEIKWKPTPHRVAQGLIRAAYDLRDISLHQPGVITVIGVRAQQLAQAARAISERPLVQSVTGGAGLIAALIAAGWSRHTGHTGQISLSRREFLHGVISLNLLQTIGGDIPHPTQGRQTLPSLLTWERISNLIPSGEEGPLNYLQAAHHLTGFLPGFQFHLTGWTDQIIQSTAAMAGNNRAAPEGLEVLEAWWNSAPVTPSSSPLPGLSDERSLDLSSAPAIWPGHWKKPGTTRNQQQEQRGAAILGVVPGSQISDYSGWSGPFNEGLYQLTDQSALSRVSLISGYQLDGQHKPSSEEEFCAKLRSELSEPGALYEMKLRDWSRVLDINRHGPPMPGYEALHAQVASHARNPWNLPAEPSLLRRIPQVIRTSLSEALSHE